MPPRLVSASLGQLQPTDVGFLESCQELASANGLPESEMTRLFRGAKAFPPTTRDRIEKYKSSPKLITELTRRLDERRATVKSEAMDRAYGLSQMSALAQQKPSSEVLLSWIKDERLKDFAAKYDPKKHGGALVMGPTGIGKTVAALCMMIRCVVREALESFDAACLQPFDLDAKKIHVPVWMACDARDLGNAVQRTGLGEREPEIITRAANADVLILEDLGWERAFHIESLLDVAAPRYKRQKPTIVTSGEKHDVLRERYTDAVLRRFWDIEGKNGAVVDCWKSK